MALLTLEHEREVLFGGAAGGGKSFGLFLCALQYVDTPGYSALLLRRTFSDLTLPGALLDISHKMLGETDAAYSAQSRTWTFPGGATITFGYLDTEADKYRYQSSAFQFIGFDELTQFTETQYLYLFSRLRRAEKVDVPIRMRAASNPGGAGHNWVRARFIDTHAPDRMFLPSKLSDNPHLAEAEYRASLANLDPVTRRQLIDGDWAVRETGPIFKREWFDVVDSAPADAPAVRFWDLAGTKVSTKNKDPDWTAGCKMVRDKNGTYYISDMRRMRGEGADIDRLIEQTAKIDGMATLLRMEQEPGSSGKKVIDYYRRGILSAYNFKGETSTGSKITRAMPLASQAEAGNIKLVRGSWNALFLDEVEVFGLNIDHDDQVDAASGAFHALQNSTRPKLNVSRS